MTAECPRCRTRIPPNGRGRPQIYCSPECKTAAELERRAERKVARFRAAAVDVAPTADRQEVLGLLWAAARLGSVQAQGTLLEELRRDGANVGETGGIIDELARKREKATGLPEKGRKP